MYVMIRFTCVPHDRDQGECASIVRPMRQWIPHAGYAQCVRYLCSGNRENNIFIRDLIFDSNDLTNGGYVVVVLDLNRIVVILHSLCKETCVSVFCVLRTVVIYGIILKMYSGR